MLEWKSDDELIALAKEVLYTPVVGDILDELGFYHQFLSQEIKPILPEFKLLGRAMPALLIDVFGKQEEPFGYLTQSLDQLEKNEVYIATGGTHRCAYWGEILTASARRRGAIGAVVDGYHRDTPKVLEQNWPVFSMGAFAQDSSVRTKVVDYRCNIEIQNILVRPGDWVFADLDGVLIIPKEVEAEVFTKALAKARQENVVRAAIDGGMSATQAYKQYGIL